MAKRTLVKICFSPRRGASFSHAKRRQKRPRGTKRPQNGTNMNPRDPKMPPEGPKMASRGANGIWRLPLPSWLPPRPPYPGKATPALTPLNLSRDSAEILQKLFRKSSETQKLFKVSFRNSSDIQKLFRNSLRNSHAGSADFTTSWLTWSPVFGGFWLVLVGFFLPGGSPPGRTSSREEFLPGGRPEDL